MAPPPSDAELLFEGKDLSKWQSGRGQAANWKVEDGYMEVSRGGDIRTRGTWSDFQMHVEWAAPTNTHDARGAELHGQGSGNSGILINNMYEIQVLDSYNDKTYPDGQAACDLRAGAPFGQCKQAAGRVADVRHHLGISTLERQRRTYPESLRDCPAQWSGGAI